MRKTKMAVLASVLASLLLLAAVPASAGLAGWQYQQEITIQENSGETLRDYQVLVELSGSDFPGDAQPDGDDIRFTDADGRELSYWIEEFDVGSERAKIWVKVPEIPVSGTVTVQMYYGNPSASGVGDGDKVFEFFDDFEDGVYTDKWETLGDGYASESDGLLYFRGGYRSYDIDIQTIKYLSWEDTLTEYKFKYAGNNIKTFYSYFNDKVHYPGYSNGFHNHFVDKSGFGSVHPSNGVWYIVTTIITASKMEGTFKGETLTETSDYSELNGPFKVTDYDDYGPDGIYLEYIRIHKYTSSEPTITIAPPAPTTHTALAITKSPTPYSIRQFQETTITVSIENTGTTDATDIEITDAIHPSFDLVSGDFPNPKRYDLIRPGETRDLQYTITAKESGTFTLDSATVTYADEDGNIQEVSSEPAPIKVISSPPDGGNSGGTSHNPSLSTASVQLHGEKTDVVLGEDILFKLSAVNLITKPTMHVQVIVIPPSGMSVTSSAFAKSGAGQYTTTYELEPGTGKDIEVAIRSNQVGDFNVNGRIIYYFGDDREDAEDHTLILPITVRAEADAGAEQAAGTSESKGSSTPGFGVVVAGMILFAIYLRRKRA